MADPISKNHPSQSRTSRPVNPEQYARLKAELSSPYRGLRKFIYVACGASGFIGALVFFAQLIAGREVAAALPNFALQIGVVALMIWFFRIDKNPEKKQ
jgi:hypothetical protein